MFFLLFLYIYVFIYLFINTNYNIGGVDKNKNKNDIVNGSLKEFEKPVDLDNNFNFDINNIMNVPPGFDSPIYFENDNKPKEEIMKEIEEEIIKSKNKIGNKSGVIGGGSVSLIEGYVPLSVEEEEREYRYQKQIQDKDRDFKLAKRELQQQELINIQSVFKQNDDYDLSLNQPDEEEEEEVVEVQEETIKTTIENKEFVDNNNNDNNNNNNNNNNKRRSSIDEIIEEKEEDWITILTKERNKKRNNKKEKEKDWAVMESMDMSRFNELVPNMAIQYPFDLDIFQKEAIYHLENNESVFVAAHTSAGKTVVAEYAIALASKHMTRTIYTSPIKALSNQKYRDFKKTFGDVGLITGDVSINQEASCLIMTTEILRSMLYRGADLLRDVEWVIFDEVHYVNDIDRGVVWEEVIIMLPAHVNFVLLSATVPNTFEFADWIGRTKKKRIYVVGTMKRPVPLEHYLYTANDLFKIVDKSGFLNGGYKAASQALKLKKEKSKSKYSITPVNSSGGNNNNYKSDAGEWNKLINQLKEKQLLPVVVFAFSKKKCEENAYGLTTVDLTNSIEKSQIHVFIEDAITRLKGTDKRLPQVLNIKELLKRGIGIHHGGLLPIIKEIVEILFSRGLVKVLFATETFAMGVNMPARTVVFNSINKHDGRNFRELLPGEYTQMSGRAGRRGLDTVGIVIINTFYDLPDASTLNTMILGKATKLESQFRLTYNMILNLLRVDDFSVQDMIKRSFSEFSSQRLLPEQQQLLKKAEAKLKTLETIDCIFGEPDIENYYSLHSEFISLEQQLLKTILNSKIGQQQLIVGRILLLNFNNIAVILKPSTSTSSSIISNTNTGNTIVDKSFTVLILVDNSITQQNNYNNNNNITPRINKGNEFEIKEIKMSEITRITKNKIKIETNNKIIENKDKGQIGTIIQQLNRMIEEYPQGPPEIDPIKDLKINDIDFVEKYQRKNRINNKMIESKCDKCPKLNEQYSKMNEYDKIKKRVNSLKFALSEENLQLMPEFQMRLQVLRKLQYIDQDNSVLLKGRVAREINTVKDELIATELIFENVLTPLSPSEIVSVLSCLLFEEKEDSEPTLTERLQLARDHLIVIATSLANIQIECGLPIVTKEYTQLINVVMMEVVHEWARGMVILFLFIIYLFLILI